MDVNTTPEIFVLLADVSNAFLLGDLSDHKDIFMLQLYLNENCNMSFLYTDLLAPCEFLSYYYYYYELEEQRKARAANTPQ